MNLRLAHSLAVFALLIFAVIWTTPTHAQVSNQQLTQIFSQSSNSYIAANAQSFANMSSNAEDTAGSTSIYNGSCCYGLMQMNTSNISTYCGCTVAQFQNESPSAQISQYSAYFSAAQSSPAIQQLETMAANGQSVGGQVVTPAMVAACAGFGAGNCAKSIANNCSGTSSAEGGDGAMNICTEAAKTNGGATPSQNPASTSTSTSTSSTNSASNSSGLTTQPDQTAAQCWACDAMARSFNIMDNMSTTLSAQLPTQVGVLFATIFASYLTIKVMMSFFLPHMRHGAGREIAALFFRFTVVMIIATDSTIYNDYVTQYALDPAIGLGAGIGNQVATAAMSAFGVSQ